ncbi:heparan-alpha-glucosaminide N-acetyltransferase [Arsukibacterium ikkense]|uniref:Heparan-alpha-glucosaminide N-acetyltransferase n=1 Tax=Arsukibacterium ikkense TaxID=336831 RepID=A0A0M2V5U3_9GAMM|nr:heparan-alpha-glucosaminide N-acetyltransferase domain-containing protein [Arsukibacterium ikkense]KKO45020.1 heparan-alpha-glucosaminide N-acetyltransferase [Arsukibacterium ikkense]
MLSWLWRHCDTILAALPPQRLLALDVLRGLTITAMILVNNPGSWSHVYGPLRHAQWHGWTITDLIFPFFIVIVGMSLQLSLQRQEQLSQALVIRQAVFRSARLFGLGLFLALFYYNFADPAYSYLEQKLLTVRWLGVLQRLALVYFATVLIVLYCGSRGRIAWLIGLCAVYLAAMLYAPYQDSYGNQFRGLWLFGNSFAAWLDHNVLGASHVYYRNATPFAFDPEGLWSSLPAVASCLSGVLLMQWLQSGRNLAQKIRGLLFVGLIAVWLAELWHFSLPINKSLWTPSFVLLSSGYCAIAMAACVWLCDVKRWRRWSAPFLVFGANAILFFMLAGVAARILVMIPVGDTVLKSWLFNRLLQPLLGNLNGSLAFALVFLLLSYLLMHWCYRKGHIFKV